MALVKQVKASWFIRLKNYRQNPIGGFLLRNWWMVAFIGISSLLYFQGIQKKIRDDLDLKNRLHALECEKKKALEEQEDLLLQIQSQNDPAWIQMTLMKGLGVVPEGQVKVYFKKEE